jgi:predicted RNA-binding Zn ribbon-like protein
MVAAEAAACGVLPVSAAHSGLAEVTRTLEPVVPAEAAGLLSFPIDDSAVRALADRLIRWLEAPEELRAATREALGRLLAIVHRAVVEGTWQRMKVCPADDCRWAFYDHSKNRSGKWCSMAECGNRMKARAYRARHA